MSVLFVERKKARDGKPSLRSLEKKTVSSIRERLHSLLGDRDKIRRKGKRCDQGCVCRIQDIFGEVVHASDWLRDAFFVSFLMFFS